MNRVKDKKGLILGITLLSVLIIGVGYAYLTTSLSINGTAITKGNTWDIHFENVQVDSGSVSADTPEINTAKDTVTYSVTLPLPGDYYTFDVDIVNGGTIDGMVDVITDSTLTTEQEKYFEFEAIYSDGLTISKSDLLAVGSTETIELTVKYKDDITASDLPASDQTVNVTFGLTYIQADATAKEVSHDSLLAFIKKAKKGNVTSDDLGKTFTIDMGDYGTHTLRVANTTTPSECSTTGFSQSACGVVLEFSDILTTHIMNDTNTGVGGWPASLMYTFVNTDIYNAIPESIRNNIIDTIVVSGHGSTSGETNFTSTDKLYLLSGHEVYSLGTSNTIISTYDSAWDNTRQLDYYLNVGVTTNSYSGAIKQYNGSNYSWWLRSTGSSDTYGFYYVDNDGNWNHDNFSLGVSPAFRIG